MNRRLMQLENNISELKDIKQKYSVTDIKRDKQKEWALRYGLLESIQVVIDISCHLVVQQNLGNAETYADCIELLSKFDYINQDLADKLMAMTGLRNILVHEYVSIDIDKLYKMLEQLDDFRQFAEAISKNIQ